MSRIDFTYHTQDKTYFSISSTTNAYGMPNVQVASPLKYIRITYAPQSEEEKPFAKIVNEFPQCEQLLDMAQEIEDAYFLSDELYKFVSKTYRLPKEQAGGTNEARQDALLQLLEDNQKRGLGAPTHEQINEALASAYATNKAASIQTDIDAVYNSFVDDEQKRREILELESKIKYKTKAYWNIRSQHEKALRAPHDTYDENETRQLDTLRTSRHNELLKSISDLMRYARNANLKTQISTFYDRDIFEQPYREQIAQLVRPLCQD